MKEYWFAPEYVPYPDVRLVQGYNKVLDEVYGICSDHIKQGLETDEAKQKSIEIAWKIYRHAERVLSELGEIQIIEVKK